jgi:hypothetical protein
MAPLSKSSRLTFNYNRPMTLGNDGQTGSARSLCPAAQDEAVSSAAHRPDDVPVPGFRQRVVCTKCGIIGADATPNWRERTRT